MRATATTALAAALLLAGAGCSDEPSYEEIAEQCVTALKDRAPGVKDKPSECDGLTEDDYSALILDGTLEDLGWTDEDGNFDEQKMLEDSLDDESLTP